VDFAFFEGPEIEVVEAVGVEAAGASLDARCTSTNSSPSE